MEFVYFSYREHRLLFLEQLSFPSKFNNVLFLAHFSFVCKFILDSSFILSYRLLEETKNSITKILSSLVVKYKFQKLLHLITKTSFRDHEHSNDDITAFRCIKNNSVMCIFYNEILNLKNNGKFSEKDGNYRKFSSNFQQLLITLQLSMLINIEHRTLGIF